MTSREPFTRIRYDGPFTVNVSNVVGSVFLPLQGRPS